MVASISYGKNLALAVDQLGNAMVGGSCDETLSARAYREKRVFLKNFINLLFWDRNHCQEAFADEMARVHLPRDYWIKSLS